MKLYEIRDPLYGFISFNDLEREIINNRSFLRLRRIKQLGLTDMVYPSATHTRFEHSLGVMHLSSWLFDTLIKKDESQNIFYKMYKQINIPEQDRIRQLIRLTALLHDVGHGPFSHCSEDNMPLKNGKDKYNHKDYSIAIINNIFDDVLIKSKNNTYGITSEQISALLEGNAEVLGDKIFWKVLIDSQLDADRADYLLRDSYHIGVKYGIYDNHRFVNCITLGKNPDKESLDLCIQRDGWHTAEALLIARYQFNVQVTYHKTRRAFDYHLHNALNYILPNSTLPNPLEIEKYLQYDDPTILSMLKDNCSSNEDCDAIINRHHIRLVHECIHNHDDKECIKEITEALDKKSFFYYKDLLYKNWYSEPSAHDIFIREKFDEVYPLERYSDICEKLKSMKYIVTRIYVKEKDTNIVQPIVDKIVKDRKIEGVQKETVRVK